MTPDHRLRPREIATLLSAQAAAIQQELAALPERVLRFHPAAGEWCAKEVLGHLIEAEQRGFAGRLPILLAGDEAALTAWDQDAVARERRDCERDVRALLEDFIALREKAVRLLESVRETDLDRAGRHPRVGRLTVGDVIQEWVFHDRNHLRQILANVQMFVWPAMGAAQRFSAGPPWPVTVPPA